MNARIALWMITALVAAATSAGDERAVYGRWRVASDSCPNVCAMSSEESGAWHGRLAIYDSTVARFGEDSCVHPVYRTHVRTDSYFLDYERISLRQLGISTDTVTVVDIQCPADWDAPGATLIVKDKNHIITVWDGVFFTLAREKK